MPWETATNDWMMAENLSNNEPPQRESPPKKRLPTSKQVVLSANSRWFHSNSPRPPESLDDRCCRRENCCSSTIFQPVTVTGGNLKKITRLFNGTNHRTQHLHFFGFQPLVLRHSWRSRLPEALNDGIWHIQRHLLFFLQTGHNDAKKTGSGRNKSGQKDSWSW